MNRFLRRVLGKIVHRYPASCLTTDNLYAYLDALYQKRDVDGAIVEVGCAWGDTTALAERFLTKVGKPKEYYCIDTFSGFTSQHLSTDLKLGLPRQHSTSFSDNSLEIVRANLNRWGVDQRIHLIKADIGNAEASLIPDGISVCLLDVDLRDPIYHGLHRLFPKLADEGVILIDDCKKSTDWIGANIGYAEFMQENGLELRYFMGLGVVEKQSNTRHSLNWQYSKEPN